MTDTIRCRVHGDQEQTFVCQHLATALETGERVGFFWASGEDGARGDAWCSTCEEARIREGGESGDWNERSQKIADIKILCGSCFDRVRAMHGY